MRYLLGKSFSPCWQQINFPKKSFCLVNKYGPNCSAELVDELLIYLEIVISQLSFILNRFLRETGPSLDWHKIEKLPTGAVCINYSYLNHILYIPTNIETFF